ncbi:MAG: metallophosphoesterase [Alphaproteobacteria bacterium]|nr:metallophosphoesterase [Alphaproteobacteria bacterium]
MTRTGALAQLLGSLFDTRELRTFLARHEGTARLVTAVNFDRPLDEVCQLVAEQLERKGLADGAFFASLEVVVPRRAAAIQAVARRWIAEPDEMAMPAPPAVGPARILHLSDLHARPRTAWDSQPLLIRLVGAVEELVKQGLGPDLIAITGDLAFSGQEEEYRLVEAWLRTELLPAAGLTPSELLIVPGNHDVDRRACRSVVVQAVEQRLLRGDQSAVAEVFGDDAQRQLIHARYAEYLAFLKRLGVPHPAAPSWSLAREVRGVPLRFAGLDTAWLASGDDTQGRLVLGLAPVNAVVPTLRGGDPTLVVALAHHPLSWLAQWDHRAVWPVLRARAHVLLRGHLHDPDYTQLYSPQQSFLELPAGACYDGHAWPMSFQLVEIDPAAGQVRVHLRSWNTSWDRWVPERTLLPPDGVATFSLG